MEKKPILENISSKDIFDNIFGFIKDQNFKLKLVSKSKKCQKKLGLQLADYEQAYLDKIGINLNDYLFCEENIFVRSFNKDILKQNLEKDLSKNNIGMNTIEKNIVDIYKEKYENECKKVQGNDQINSEVQIEIYSPFFEILSKTDFFENFFTISMSMYIIDKFGLKDDYISAFYNLNSWKSKYSSLKIYYEDSYDVLYLKEFNINFKQIKKLNFIPNSYHITGDYKYFLNNFFSYFRGDENNLKCLKLGWIHNEINWRDIDNFNNFKSLEVLSLTGFKFAKTFILKISNLKSLTLDSCENIGFADNVLLNVKKLDLNNCSIVKHKSLLELPNLEDCELTYAEEDNQKYYSIFDISSFKKLKKFVGAPCDFIYMDSIFLEYLKLTSFSDVSSEDTIKIFKILINLKLLKEINIEFGKIDDNEILWIIGKNTSVKKMKISWVKNNENLIIYNLLDKFPYLSNLEITSPEYENNHNMIIKIIENKGCRINKFNLHAGIYHNIEFYCKPFENLIEIKLALNGKIINIKDALPLFANNCNIVFRALSTFELTTISDHVIKLYALENLCNNIECMPNLSNLLIKCSIQEKIEKDFYMTFIKKCLNLKLIRIYFSIHKRVDELDVMESYSKEELEKICPDIKNHKYKEFFVKKLSE